MKKTIQRFLSCAIAVVMTGLCVPTASAATEPWYRTKNMGQVTVFTDGLVVGHDSFRVFVNLNGYIPQTVSSKITGDFTEAEQRAAVESGKISLQYVAPMIPSISILDKGANSGEEIIDVKSYEATDYFRNVYVSKHTYGEKVFTIIPPGDDPVKGLYIQGSAYCVAYLNGEYTSRKTTHYIYMDGQLIVECTSNNARIESYKIHDANFQTDQTQKDPISVNPTTSTVYVDGEKVDMGAYLINDNNYIKLRDIAYVLQGTPSQFDVAWHQDKSLIEIFPGEAYTVQGGELGDLSPASATISTSQITRELLWYGKMVRDNFLPKAYNIGSNNFYKLRDIGHIAGFTVEWDAATNSVQITTTVN